MRCRSMAVSFALMALLIGPFAQAEIGQISIDGEILSSDLFAIRPRPYCPPHSDKRIRDRVITDWLIIEESEKRGYELTDFQKEWIEKAGGRSLSGSELFDKDRSLLEAIAREYRGNRHYEVMQEELDAEYAQAVKDGDPEVTNVRLFRATKSTYRLDDEQSLADHDTIVTGHADGKRWPELVSHFAVNGVDENTLTEDTKNWLTLDHLSFRREDEMASLVGDGSGLKAGDLIGPLSPDRFDKTALIYIHEVQIVETVGLNDTIDRRPAALKSTLKFRIQKKQRDFSLETILAGHAILENGMPIVPGGPYESCP